MMKLFMSKNGEVLIRTHGEATALVLNQACHSAKFDGGFTPLPECSSEEEFLDQFEEISAEDAVDMLMGLWEMTYSHHVFDI